MSIEVARRAEETAVAIEGCVVPFVEGVRRGEDVEDVDPGLGDASQSFLEVRVGHAGHDAGGPSQKALRIGLAGRLQFAEGSEPIRHPGDAPVFDPDGKKPDDKDACATERGQRRRPRAPTGPAGRGSPDDGDGRDPQQEQPGAGERGGEKQGTARGERRKREQQERENAFHGSFCRVRGGGAGLRVAGWNGALFYQKTVG